MKYIGFLLLLIGAAGMDTPNMIVSAAMVSVGLILLLVESKKESGADPHQRAAPQTKTTMPLL